MVDSCLALIHEKTGDYIKELARWEREEKQLCLSLSHQDPSWPLRPQTVSLIPCTAVTR